VEIRTEVPGQPRKKVRETLSQPIGWAQWFIPVIPAMQGSTNRRITVETSLSIK
jgi:hypothetical protein